MIKWIVGMSFGMMLGTGFALSAENATYDAHGRRDPFIPLVSAGGRGAATAMGIEQFDEIKVEGVVYDPKSGSVAVLNGAVLKEGDSLGNAKLIKIEAGGVLVSLNGLEQFRPLYQEEKKTGDA